MDDKDFLINQFHTLREEIKESKSRLFKITWFGIVSGPVAFWAIRKKDDTDVLFLSLPIIIVTIGVLYIIENHTIMRAGTYIKHHIEPHIIDKCGWEKWLSCNKEFDSRTVDQWANACFIMMFALYYIASVYYAEMYLLKLSTIVTGIGGGVYIGFGIIFFGFLFKRNLRDTQATKLKCHAECEKNPQIIISAKLSNDK